MGLPCNYYVRYWYKGMPGFAFKNFGPGSGGYFRALSFFDSVTKKPEFDVKLLQDEYIMKAEKKTSKPLNAAGGLTISAKQTKK